jgi:phage terminase large subunit GpA-like protein
VTYASADEVIARSRRAWKPPPRLSLSEWADKEFVLSAETAAEPGRWRTLPYQKEIMDAITDPAVTQISVMKSARIGFTLCVSAAIGYFICQDPSSVLVVQPTVDDAKNFSKEAIAPMLRDVPALSRIVFRDVEKGPKDPSNTLTHKAFPGGVISLVGANSGAGFRRISRRVVIFDEVDAYPPSAGSEGDQIKLGTKRSEAFWNRKIIAGSTPLLAGVSRIEEMYGQGDQRRYFVPCPQCGHMAPLVFSGDDGHSMKWPTGKPKEAFFACQGSGCVIEHKDKRSMVTAGEWRAAAPFTGHASFRIWSAYSYSPNATWGQIASEFVEANALGPEKLRTVVNTTLGETWHERGEAPDYQRLYQRRESYEIATVPAGVLIITAGVDVQRDRLVFEVVGWGEDRQSWSIDAGVLPGNTAGEEVWAKLDELLGRSWPGADGLAHQIHMLAVDAGDQTQVVYNWARRYPMSRVIACKGVATAKTIIGAPSAVDVTVRGKRLSRGYKVWPIGVGIAKSELYGWLRLDPPTKESGLPYPPGYCHAPEYGEEYFRQLTAEQLVPIVRRTGFTVLEWQILPGRENHWLDCRVYARAAAALAGLDRHAAAKRARPAPPPAAPPASPGAKTTPPPAPEPPPRGSTERPGAQSTSWLGRGRGSAGGRGSWIPRRR